MVVLGLGSNLGDRLENLRHAFFLLKNSPEITVKQVSPVYISNALLPDGAPSHWNMPHLNVAIRCETTFHPLALLEQIKRLELALGQQKKEHWGPRIIDIDILCWDDLQLKSRELTIPHAQLAHRPFALFPLADIAPLWIMPTQNLTAEELSEKFGSRFDGNAPFATTQIQHRIDTPRLVGIVNITPDSFSDGGLYQSVEKALQHCMALAEAGAEVLDFGAESTSPRAAAISSQLEWQRLAPVLSTISSAKQRFKIMPKISVDTRHVDVASKALDFGVDWINDVTGLTQPAMCELVRNSNADCVLMHHRSIPEDRANFLPRNQNPVSLVLKESAAHLNTLEKMGINRERIIFDPGIGFGKLAEQSLELLRNIEIFSQLQTRLLVGHSRKSFLSLLTEKDYPERDVETLAIALSLAQQPVDYLRVHHVEMCARGFKALKAVEFLFGVPNKS